MARVGSSLKSITQPGDAAFACLIEVITVDMRTGEEHLIGRYFYNLPGQAKSMFTKIKADNKNRIKNPKYISKCNVFHLKSVGNQIIWEHVDGF